MHRRTYLAVAGGTAVGAAGCLGGEPSRPTELIDVHLEGMDRTAAPALDDPPRISVVADAALVLVEGTLSYGSSTCGGYDLEAAAYDADDASFRVLLEDYHEQEAGEDCTADEVTTSYRVRAVFDDGVPASVTAIEDDNLDVRESTYP